MYLTFFIALLVILNPIGNAAIYIGMTSENKPHELNHIAKTCAFAISIILLLALWVGLPLLHFFGITIGTFKFAGGLIVLGIALSMMKGKPHTHEHNGENNTQKNDPVKTNPTSIAVVPMAIPIIAGPGAISVIVSRAHDLTSYYQMLLYSLICISTAIILWIVLKFAPWIGKKLGKEGMMIVSRIMALILASIAVSMLQSGLISMFPILSGAH